ncbi:hypothetical protein [Enterocloster bolteae]|uniref:hypothetical protein n=1 Tax=Enterocloster bolteae TaxID=208479 RepID=UPI0027B90BBF|nr:hypothetical protein [Enterocloster bolteae]
MAAPEGYTKLGNVGYADKGVYSADATYNKYNTVYHEGSTYVALKDNLHGVTPADGANWRYMAKGFTEASADAITVIDTSGIIDGTKNKKTILQTFLDKVGDFIINKAVTNDALMLKLADYVAKTDIVQVESTATNKVPSSAYLKQVKDSIDSNLADKLLIKNNGLWSGKNNADDYRNHNIIFYCNPAQGNLTTYNYPVNETGVFRSIVCNQFSTQTYVTISNALYQRIAADNSSAFSAWELK